MISLEFFPIHNMSAIESVEYLKIDINRLVTLFRNIMNGHINNHIKSANYRVVAFGYTCCSCCTHLSLAYLF